MFFKMNTNLISKKLLGSIIFLSANIAASAQDYTIDAVKFAESNTIGTARSIGFGGALGSVGGDFSSLSVNPAGIAIYRSSEFMMSPGLRFSGSKTNYTGTEARDNGTRFGFNNIGMVFTQAEQGESYKKSDWKAVSFAIGINRIADFSRNYTIKGSTNTSSASQYFEGDAIRYPSSTTDDVNTPAYLGFQSYLLGSSPNYTTLVPYAKGINQEKTIEEKGGTTEMALSFGGNYQEKLLLGATVSIPFTRRVLNTSMYEQTIDPLASNDFDHFTYNENITTTGAGINLKLGAIYKFSDYFRAGVAFHTPTAMSLTETSNASIVNSASINDDTEYRLSTDDNVFDYTIFTPFKTVLSATGILGKHGFVSVDYEYVNYASMRFRSDDKFFQNQQNQQIKNIYQSASNVRLGLELRFDKLFVRGGYGFYGSPYQAEKYQSNRSNISAGLGYRFDNMFLDFGLVNSNFTTSAQPYVLDGSLGFVQPAIATTKNNLTSGVVTIGWKL